MRFHVGDRWADQRGDEWWLYQLDTDGEVRGVRVSDGVSHWFRDGRNNLYKLELTRLISSERGIPFVEMLPDATHESKQDLAEFGRLLHECDGRRREARQLLIRMVKYVREDRAVTPGQTRLSRLTDEVSNYLKRTQDPSDILRGDT